MDSLTDLSRQAREFLVQLMDQAELQIDLGYTALLFNDRTLAEDVIELHQKIDHLFIQYEQTVLKLGRFVDAPEKLWSLLRVAYGAKKIADSANMVADVVLRGLPAHPVLQHIFESSKETVRRIVVGEGSQLDHKTLGDVRLQEITGMRIICIKRGDDWIHDLSSATITHGGDILFVRGPQDGGALLRNLANSQF